MEVVWFMPRPLYPWYPPDKGVHGPKPCEEGDDILPVPEIEHRFHGCYIDWTVVYIARSLTLFWMIPNAKTFKIYNSVFSCSFHRQSLHSSTLTGPTWNNDFTVYARYKQWKFVFGKGLGCNVDWSIGTSYCRLAVTSVTTKNSDFYITTQGQKMTQW
jgi:hypothetical protein